jgi:DNA-binding PadR family transcriptional regulator
MKDSLRRAGPDWAYWALLALADNQWHHGYGVLQGIRGFCDQRIPTGVLYPLLERLTRDGLLESDRGSASATYHITADGHAALQARIQLYRCALEAAESVAPSAPPLTGLEPGA